MDKLPSDYAYISVPDVYDKYISFRIKEVKDKETVEAWVDKYSKETKTTWRKRRTFPNCGKFNVYKIEYRCCHNTDRRAKGTGPSKHTGCDAKIIITINRFIENSKRRRLNMHLIESHPCLVLLYDKHNHAINTAESLRHRDLSPAVKKHFISLFYKGHRPTSALKSYKAGLMLELGDKYHIAAADSMTMPSYSIVHKLYEKEFLKNHIKDVLNEDRTPDNNWFDPSYNLERCSSSNSPQLQGIDVPSFNIKESEQKPHLFNIGKENRSELLTPANNSSDGEVEEVCLEITKFCNEMKEKVRHHKAVFLPAVKKMLANRKKLLDTDLLTAMHNFGSYSSRRQNTVKQILQRRHKTKVNVTQSKRSLLDKKRISTGEPHGQTPNTSASSPCLDLTTFRSLPTNERKEPYDLQTYNAYDNNNLIIDWESSE